MSDAKDFDPAAVVDAMAPMLGIEVTPEYRPGVILNLEVTARFARLVLETPLDEREEPAAVYRP